VTLQINFRESAKGTTILGVSGDMPSGKFCKITPKNTHFCAFWKQVLHNTVFTFFNFWGLRGWPWHSGLPPPYASACRCKDWRCVVLREIDFLLKMCDWSLACFNCARVVRKKSMQRLHHIHQHQSSSCDEMLLDF